MRHRLLAEPLALLLKTRQYILDHPEEYDQCQFTRHNCKSPCCIAGHICWLSNEKPSDFYGEEDIWARRLLGFPLELYSEDRELQQLFNNLYGFAPASTINAYVDGEWNEDLYARWGASKIDEFVAAFDTN